MGLVSCESILLGRKKAPFLDYSHSWDVMVSPVSHLVGKCGAGKQRFELGPVFYFLES